MLINELESFDELDAPDLYCQFYDKFDGDKYKDCTIVPFSLRLIHAEALRFSSTPWNCIPRIERLESNIDLLICKMIKETMPAIQIEDWKKRLECVHLMKARTLYFLKQTTQSSSLYNKIVNETKDDKFKRQLLEMLTRLSISCGDEQAMEKFFKELNSQSNVNQYYFHKCLRAVFHGNYLNAQEQLQNLVHIDVTEPSFVNNLAVAHLYNGNPNEGNELLKKYKEIPPEVIFTNVYTLSELITDKAVYIQNKMFAKFADKLGDGSNAKDIKILYD
uniref:TPR_REGION domain-containing protein n=1 Tax=Rhabditophanes sp. KR3021 TaxID=114890 RepID=A0AC35TZN7_9BILA